LQFHFLNTAFRRRVLLCLCWCGGIVVGALLSMMFSPAAISLMRSAPGSTVSIVGLLIAVFFPFLVSYGAYRLKLWFFILPIGFFRAVLFCLIYSLIYLSFGSAGWLVTLIFYLPDLACAFVLFFFQYRLIATEAISRRLLCSTFIFCAVIILFNICLIVPFCETVFQ